MAAEQGRLGAGDEIRGVKIMAESGGTIYQRTGENGL